MSLAAGTQFGPYEILHLIGAGGMGEVYRARDSHLKRQVAIKILPQEVATDPERLARFQREAEVLAALNHPNIAQIHGLQKSDGVTALVMELVEGPALADRIARGPLPQKEALRIAKQIAEALEAAHDQGIVHRDLKPANIQMRDDGVVKLLDFGLAKAVEPTNASSPSASISPTITSSAMTAAGVILGTAAYMSPEQARGLTVDKRTDIWAFGCVLYEMLSGRRAFEGRDASETLARILTSDPDASRLPPETPLAIRRLVRRCLQRDRNQRQRDITDVRIEIEEVLAAPVEEAESTAPGTVGRRPAGWAIFAAGLLAGSILAAGVAWWLAIRSSARVADSPVFRALLDITPAERLRSRPGDDSLAEGRPSRTAIALSPDGQSLVFSAVRDNQQQLYVRRLDRLEAVPIAGTEGGGAPFFSPDGRWVGFDVAGTLKKVPLAGGTPVFVADAPAAMGASWGADDRIVFALLGNGLWQVPAAGGRAERLTSLEAQPRGLSYRFPQVLPGGRAVLFTIPRALLTNWEETQIVVQSFATGQRKVLIEGGADARYLSTGHLVYARNGALLVAPFDVERLQVTGGSVGLVPDLMQAANLSYAGFDSGAGQFSVSETGALAYVRGGAMPDAERSLVWVDRNGRVEPLSGPRRFFFGPRLSPDGRHILAFIGGTDQNIWLQDVVRGTLTPLTTGGDSFFPVWTPDGKRVVFPRREGPSEYNLYWMLSDGSGTPERLTRSDGGQVVSSVSPDGREVAYVDVGEGKIWALPLTGNRQPRLVIDARDAAYPVFSPDGRWLAYTLADSGQPEVYVQAYPGPGGKRQVSTNGGREPAWRPDGRELFYRSLSDGRRDTMFAVPVTLGPTFALGTPKSLFEGAFVVTHPARGYDVARDGQRFLMVRHHDRAPIEVREIVIVQNWFEELKAKVPPN